MRLICDGLDASPDVRLICDGLDALPDVRLICDGLDASPNVRLVRGGEDDILEQWRRRRKVEEMRTRAASGEPVSMTVSQLVRMCTCSV